MIIFLGLFVMYTFTGNADKFFLYLTYENLMVCSLYLLLVAYYEITDQEDNASYKFLTHRIGKFVFTACITVVQSYWTYVLMGSDVISFPYSVEAILVSIYVHFIIGLLMLFEISTNKRSYVKGVFYKDLKLLFLIMVIYTVILVSISKGLGLFIYDFHKKSIVNILGFNIVSISNMCSSYLLYYALSRRLHKNSEDSDLIINDFQTL